MPPNRHILHNEGMVTPFKFTLSRRWLALFLLTAALPLAVLGLWNTKHINTLVDEGLDQSLTSEVRLLQSLIEQKLLFQRQLARQSLHYRESGKPLSKHSQSLQETIKSICYFEKVDADTLESVCQVSNKHLLVTNRQTVSLNTFQASVKQPTQLGLMMADTNGPTEVRRTLSLRERWRGNYYLSRKIALIGKDGRPVAQLIVREPQDVLKNIHQRRIRIFWVLLIGAFLIILLFAKRFRVEFLEPVEALSEVAQQVSDGQPAQRIPETTRYAPLQKTVRQFNQMLDQLAEKKQLQDNFIANLTHDLRTPLMAQERAFELFNDEFRQVNLPHLEKLSAGLIKNNQHLLSMVNQLLETYQFDAGKLKLRFQPIQPIELLEGCIQQLQPLANEKDITVQLVSEETIPEISADIRALQRVFLNVIGNAIENIPKHSQITLQIERNAEQLCVSIRDNGPGLTAEEMSYLFDRFYSSLLKKRKLGSGLGLYICRMLVEAHSGRITVDSQPGEYTVFTIYLPLERT